MYRTAKKKCEICEVRGPMLDRHHIIPRTDPRSTDLDSNLAIICANCHRRVHANEVIIEGVFRTTMGRKLFFHEAGQRYVVNKGIHLKADGTAEIRG